MLEFMQDELRDEDGSVDEFGLAHVSDPAVDDHARIHDFDVLFRAAFEELFKARGVELLTLPDTNDNTDVAEETVHEQKDKIHDAPFKRHELERGRNNICGHQAKDETKNTSDDDF